MHPGLRIQKQFACRPENPRTSITAKGAKTTRCTSPSIQCNQPLFDSRMRRIHFHEPALHRRSPMGRLGLPLPVEDTLMREVHPSLPAARERTTLITAAQRKRIPFRIPFSTCGALTKARLRPASSFVEIPILHRLRSRAALQEPSQLFAHSIGLGFPMVMNLGLRRDFAA
jgi:hypothetical protein